VAIQLILTAVLDPLPHLYTISSDDFESEKNPSAANCDNKIEQGESDFYESVLLPLTIQGSIFTDSQHSGVQTPPWAPVHSESAPPTEDEANMTDAPSPPSATQPTPEQCSPAAGSEPTINLDLPSPPLGLEVDAVNAPTSLSGIPEQCPADSDVTIESDSSPLPSFAMGNEWCRHLKSGDRNIRYTLHPKINGDNLFFLTAIPLTDFIDQEPLVITTAVIRNLASDRIHHPPLPPLTQMIGECSRASMASKWQSCCTAKPTCLEGTLIYFHNFRRILEVDYLSQIIGSSSQQSTKSLLGTFPGIASWSSTVMKMDLVVTVVAASADQSGCQMSTRFSTAILAELSIRC